MIYSPQRFDHEYLKVVGTADDREHFIQQPLWANDDTQVCLVEIGDDLLRYERPFKIMDLREGNEKSPAVRTIPRWDDAVAIVLGGGPSCLDSLEGIDLESNPVIAVNHYHSSLADFVCFCDRRTAPLVDPKPIHISIWGDLSDYWIDPKETGCWFHSSSSFLALWLASRLCSDIYLAGFDLYRNLDTPPPLEPQLEQWRLARTFLPSDLRIVAAKDSPLTEVFG